MDKREIVEKKILDSVGLDRMLAFWRFKGLKVAMAYGTFDGLKPGAIDMLFQAANKGSVLLVAVKPDDVVKKHKGEGNPSFNQCNRATMVASQLLVSAVYLVEVEDPTELIQKVQPVALAYCMNAADIEVKAFEQVKNWKGEFIQIDTSKTFESYTGSGCGCEG